MTTEAQALADRLAELAGWTQSNSSPEKYDEPYWYRSHPNGSPHHEFNHPFPVGSLDALERFRRERLPGWDFTEIEKRDMNDVRVTIWKDPWAEVPRSEIFNKNRMCVYFKAKGPDEWSARASTLIAACTKEPPHAQP